MGETLASSASFRSSRPSVALYNGVLKACASSQELGSFRMWGQRENHRWKLSRRESSCNNWVIDVMNNIMLLVFSFRWKVGASDWTVVASVDSAFGRFAAYQVYKFWWSLRGFTWACWAKVEGSSAQDFIRHVAFVSVASRCTWVPCTFEALSGMWALTYLDLNLFHWIFIYTRLLEKTPYNFMQGALGLLRADWQKACGWDYWCVHLAALHGSMIQHAIYSHYCALIMLILVARRLPPSLALQSLSWFVARSQRCTEIVQWSPVSPKHPSCAKCQRRLWCIRGANTCVQDDVSSSKLCWNTRGKRWQQLLALWEDLSHLGFANLWWKFIWTLDILGPSQVIAQKEAPIKTR